MRAITIVGLNPEPWAVGKAYSARSKNGKLSARVSPNSKLQAYQNALRDEFDTSFIEEITGEVFVRFFFWRQIETGSTGTKTMSGHEADVTNLQKATEDAMQGYFFKNDNMVKGIMSQMMEQSKDTTPTVMIFYGPMREMEGISTFDLDTVYTTRNAKIYNSKTTSEDRMKW